MLNIDSECTDFDVDMVININSVLSILAQMGVGPQNGFIISGPDETWGQFLTGDANLEMVKSYIYLKVKLIFDPPQSSAVIDSSERLITELEYRIAHPLASS